MKITDLDEDRLKYIWSDFTEQTYQTLQRVDTLEWRVYFTGYPNGEIDRKGNQWRIGTYYFLAYSDGLPVEHTHVAGTTTLYWGVGSLVDSDLTRRLMEKERLGHLPYVTKEQYDTFKAGHSWEV